jgi:hypothetical protein
VYTGGYDPRELLSLSDLGSIDNLLLSRLIPVAVAAFRHPHYEARKITRWLAVLAVSLESGHDQIGPEHAAATDLVLYRLPGPRGPRRLARLQYAVTFAACCGVLAPLLAQAWRVNGRGNAISVTLAFLLLNMVFSLPTLYVSPVPVRLLPYRRRPKVRDLLTRISRDGRVFLALLARFGSVSLLMWVITAESLPVLRPGAPLRQDLALSGVIAAAVTPWAFVRPQLALAAAVVVWFCGTRAWLRYGLAVADYRLHGLLPLRLGRFLVWAHGAGLVRVAGIAYQFRHAEFQHWLAAEAARPRSRPG